MKIFTTIILAIIVSISANAQDILRPEIMTWPDISEKAIQQQAEIIKKYSTLEVALEDGGKTLSEADVTFMAENETLALKGLFSTAALGCDWYCAGGPNKIESTTSLKSSKTTSYEAANTHDWDLKTAWASNTNKGIGEVLTFYFKPSEILGVTQLQIYNGYQKSETTWKNNSRAKKIEVSVNGKSAYTLELEDVIQMQQFTIGEQFSPPNEDLVIALKIVEIYPGEKYEDLCISEVNFDGVGDH